MKTFLTVLIACALCGCEPQTKNETVTIIVSGDQLIQLEEDFGQYRWQMLTNALAHSANVSDVLPQLCAAQAKWDIEILASQSIKELNRKLDTLHRGTSRHGYTEAQLLTAIRIKEKRIADKP